MQLGCGHMTAVHSSPGAKFLVVQWQGKNLLPGPGFLPQTNLGQLAS
jgi:hypothetical protein